MRKFRALLSAGVAALSASLSADVRTLDPAEPLRDLTGNPAGAAFGFDGDLGESVFTDADWYYREDAEATVRAFRSVGARLVRQQRALSRFQGERATRLVRWEKGTRAKRADAARILDPKVKVSWTDPKNVFELYRKAGLKAILCLDRYAYDPAKDELTEDPEVSAKAVGDFLRWIVANGYKDLVVGFEMENESYYRDNPEQYGARWRRVLPEMRRIWPDVKIGCSLPIYVDADPDLIAVRDRARAEMNLKDVLNRHTPEYVNKSFYRQMTALGDEVTNVTHAIIHVYGATPDFTCSYTGILRARAMLKAFPMLAGRHFWITEWRERSVEDMTCQRAFRSSLWKATFLLMTLAQPDVDASCLHNTVTHAGVFHQSDGTSWQRCYERKYGFKRGKTKGPRPPELKDTTGVGRRHLAVGAAGAMFSVVNPALDGRPLVLGYGSDHGFLASAKYYSQYHTLLPKKGIPVAGDTVWTAVAEKDLASVALVAVNTRPEESSVEISVKGFRPGAKGRLRLVRCPDPARIDELENPNGDLPWTIEERTVEVAGPTIRLDVPRDAIAALVVPADVAQTPADEADETDGRGHGKLVSAACPDTYSAAHAALSAADVLDTLRKVGDSRKYIVSWTHPWPEGSAACAERTQDGGWRAKPLDRIELKGYVNGHTGKDPLLYSTDFYCCLGTWENQSVYARNMANMEGFIRKAYDLWGSVPVFSWHVENPYATAEGVKDKKARGCPYRYRYSCASYPQEHKYVLREIVAGTGGVCGGGRAKAADEASAPTFPTPRAWYDAQLDKVCAFLKRLVDRNGRPIPVVVRPFHECEDDWSWWGGKSSTCADYIAAFRYTADEIRRRTGLGSLIFLYSPDRYWSTEADFMRRYPGDDVVDLIGFDDYSIGCLPKGWAGDAEEGVLKSLEATIRKMRIVSDIAARRGKAAGLMETGVMGDFELTGLESKAIDAYSLFRRAMTAEGVRFAFFNTWGGIYTVPKSDYGKKAWREFLDRPEALTAGKGYAFGDLKGLVK